MSHQLELQEGKASMMYVGERPWHGLGTRLPRLATAEEAIGAARLDWEVAKVPRHSCLTSWLHSSSGPGGRPCALIRQDPGGWHHQAVLGYVDEAYTPLQNRAAFGFFDPVLGAGAAVFDTAGALGRGEKVWILARVPGEIKVAGTDLVHKYLLLANSHDGSGGVEIRFSPVRVVCGNTLMLALRLSRGLHISHTPDLQVRLRQAAENIESIDAGFTEIARAFQRMASFRMNRGSLSAYLNAVFPSTALSARTGSTTPDRVQRLRIKAAWLSQNGRGNNTPPVRATLWAAYNGVTELVDYYTRAASPDDRLRSIWFGEGAEVKARAYEIALQMAECRPADLTLPTRRWRPARREPATSSAGTEYPYYYREAVSQQPRETSTTAA